MKRLLLSLLIALTAVPTFAADPPKTVVLPSQMVSDVFQYLASRPYSEVATILDGVKACIQIQVPDAKGAIVDRGQCPPVTEALRAEKSSAPAELPKP